MGKIKLGSIYLGDDAQNPGFACTGGIPPGPARGQQRPLALGTDVFLGPGDAGNKAKPAANPQRRLPGGEGILLRPGLGLQPCHKPGRICRF